MHHGLMEHGLHIHDRGVVGSLQSKTGNMMGAGRVGTEQNRTGQDRTG